VSEALIVVNPAAGGSPQAVGPEVADRCRRWLGAARVHRTTRPGEATELARAAAGGTGGAGVVVAVGGDGTARDVAQGLAGTGVPLFIVPAGTANSCYRTLWGDRPWQQALDLALADPAGTRRRIDLARLADPDRLVLAGACAGFPPQAIHDAAASTDLAGRARYEAALVALIPRYRPYPGRVVVDGTEVHRGPTLLANVGGSRYRGGQYDLLPHSLLDDGQLDVCVVGGEHPPAQVLALTRTGGHLARPGVVYARGRRVTIERTDGQPVWFEHDGEVLAGAGCRYTLEVVPGAVEVLADPAGTAFAATAAGALTVAGSTAGTSSTAGTGGAAVGVPA
jgi:diacylglycerol kinase (ATP)